MADTPEAAIVYSDEALAVIDKPAGLVVHPAPSYKGPTLVDQLGDLLEGGDPDRPGIVHRLDKDTSGLLVVARTDAAHQALAAEVAARAVDRVYLALASGRLDSRTGTIDAPIGRERRTRTRMAVAGAGSREARTHFEVLELLRAASYVEVTLETGRTHQIRAHFDAIGHALVGDRTYGPGSTRREGGAGGGKPVGGESNAAYGLSRQFLHAHRLAFTHPVSGERLEFRSELPADLTEALKTARAA